MIKLAAMGIFIAVGGIVGSAFYRLFVHGRISHLLCIGLGILGAFAGILLADIADIHFIGNIVDSLLFASLGSICLLSLNLLLRNKA